MSMSPCHRRGCFGSRRTGLACISLEGFEMSLVAGGMLTERSDVPR
jgi:hypothetical protein